MPRKRVSKGTIRIGVVFPNEFQKFLLAELENLGAWNPGKIRIAKGIRSWKASTEVWTIKYDGRDITAISNETRIYLRKGLDIDMVNATLNVRGEA